MKVTKKIIEIDEETFQRICDANSVPDIFGTDIVNGLNAIRNAKPYEEHSDSDYERGFYDGLSAYGGDK